MFNVQSKNVGLGKISPSFRLSSQPYKTVLMNNKQQQLTFSKGITNVPSDALCSDNTLEESVGLVYSDSEHRVIQKPSLHMTGLNGKTLLYIHVYNDQKRYIVLDDTSLKWGTNASGTYTPGGNLFTVTGTPNITSIGKILIVSDNNGIHSYLWKTNSYDSITYPFPEIGLDVVLGSPVLGDDTVHSGSATGIIQSSGVTGGVKVKAGQRDAYNNLVVGLYNKNLNYIASQKGFARPFAIRMALELYDGSYTFITNPVLLFPTVTESTYAFFDGAWNDGEFNGNFCVDTYYSRLFVKQTTDYSEYHDIIKDVVLFATRGVDIYNTTVDQPLDSLGTGSGIVVANNISADTDYLNAGCEYRTFTNTRSVETYNRPQACLEKRDTIDIKNDLISDTVFYKVCSLGLKSIDEYTDIASLTSDSVLKNLTTQEQLGDDYFSRSNMKPNLMYAYNSRLNLANVSRGVFEGFDFFTPLANDSINGYSFYVKIKLDTESVWVRHSCFSQQKQGIYFFYPDSRAEHITIYKNAGDCVCDAELTESESLNGAYYLREYPSSTTDEIIVTVGDDGFHLTSWTKDGEQMPADHTNNYAFEMLPNYVIQSEVNNPFVFKAAGYFKVGTGKILAMSSITQALSEGQFGQFPLLVFSESGIWTLAVASTGYYSSVHPMSREVALLDNPCITQTDGAVFFASEKGLMVVVGAQVKCVSEQLSGKANGINISDGAFQDYLKNAFIAYDYRDSLLWIFNPDSGFEEYCYIYSMKTGTFAKYLFTSAITNIVDNYPDYLLQSGTSVFSLLDRPNINSTEESANTYTATMITRPMKLENALALKSIMQVKHIHDMQGSLTLRIFASNKLSQSDSDWVELFSLRGVPWKYYKFRYDFTGLKATDRFAGTMLITQERRTDKLR